MKKFFTTIGVTLAMIVAVLAAVVVIFYYAVFKYVSLGNDITWEYAWHYWKGQKPTSALKKDGRVVVGFHSFMELWGAYPYIAGKFVAYEPVDEDTLDIVMSVVYFVYDVSTNQVTYYKDWQEITEKYALRFTVEDMVVFWDLAGPWKNSEKLEALRNALKPPDN